MSEDALELGCKISLISKAGIRYEGRLFTVDPDQCTIALSGGKKFFTITLFANYAVIKRRNVSIIFGQRFFGNCKKAVANRKNIVAKCCCKFIRCPNFERQPLSNGVGFTKDLCLVFASNGCFVQNCHNFLLSALR